MKQFVNDKTHTKFSDEQMSTVKSAYEMLFADSVAFGVNDSQEEIFWSEYIAPKIRVTFSEKQIEVVNEIFNF